MKALALISSNVEVDRCEVSRGEFEILPRGEWNENNTLLLTN